MRGGAPFLLEHLATPWLSVLGAWTPSISSRSRFLTTGRGQASGSGRRRAAELVRGPCASS